MRRRAALHVGSAPEVRQQPTCDRRRQGGLSAHDLLQFLDQNLEAVLLEQVAVGPLLQRRKEVVVVGIERGDDLGGGVMSQLDQQIEAIAVWQFEVDEDQLERVRTMHAGRAPGQSDLATRTVQIAGLGDGNGVTETLTHHAAKESPCHRVVFEDQNLDCHVPPPVKRGC